MIKNEKLIKLNVSALKEELKLWGLSRSGLRKLQIQLTEEIFHRCPNLSEEDMAKNDNIAGFCKGARHSTRRNRKTIFNLHQFFCPCVNDQRYEFTWMGLLSTGLNRFHQKHRRSHVVRFIVRALAERNLEMFAAIVKLGMLFYTILAFAHFTHNPTLLA